MRWTLRRQRIRADEWRQSGRRSRVVLTPRRWRQVGGGDVGPNGPDTPQSAGDGGKKARSPGRARYKPLKPLRRKRRMNPAKPVVTMLVCSTHFAHEAAGAAGTRRFLHPLVGGYTSQLGRTASRDRGGVSRRHCERSEAIHSRKKEWIASSLRFSQ
jgi:hypothetical protein